MKEYKQGIRNGYNVMECMSEAECQPFLLTLNADKRFLEKEIFFVNWKLESRENFVDNHRDILISFKTACCQIVNYEYL